MRGETMTKVLVVDDEQLIRRLVCDFLRKEGYSCIEASDGQEALEQFTNNPDTALVLLDVMMPQLDGWEVCRQLRRLSQVPIIMLTARGEEYDELQGFRLGADDYITKPFSPSVLVARVRAMLKRASETSQADCLQAGSLLVNAASHQVTLDGKVLDLSPKEYDLLCYLMTNRGKLLSREQLLDQVWGYDYLGGPRTVDTHVGRLRLKLGPWVETYIHTIRGYGYKFEADL